MLILRTVIYYILCYIHVYTILYILYYAYVLTALHYTMLCAYYNNIILYIHRYFDKSYMPGGRFFGLIDASLRPSFDTVKGNMVRV